MSKVNQITCSLNESVQLKHIVEESIYPFLLLNCFRLLSKMKRKVTCFVVGPLYLVRTLLLIVHFEGRCTKGGPLTVLETLQVLSQISQV